MLLEILLAGLTAVLLSWFFKRYQRVKVLDKIPGPNALPMLGNSLDFSGSHRTVFETFERYCRDFGSGMMRMYLGLQPYVLLCKAEYVEKVLSSNQWISKSTDYSYLFSWLGSGLLTSTGSKWRSRRKLLTPAFHFKILEDFLEVFDSQSKVFVRKLEELCDSKKPINVFPIVTLCTLDIIIEAAMGNESNLQSESESEYVNAIQKLGALLQHRQTHPQLYPDFLYWLSGYKAEEDKYLRILHEMSMSNIQKRKNEYKKKQAEVNDQPDTEAVFGKKRRLAFLDLMIEESEKSTNPLTDLDLREEVDTFMFEGHDTTASAISFSLYWLSQNPKIQDLVYEEIQEVVGDSENITLNHVRELKYLECCIKEALRLTPSVPFIGRYIEQDIEIDGQVIPAGTNVLLMFYSLHRDPEEFPEPLKFDPDRFLPDAISKRHPYSYVPFSAGPRNCIGQKFALMEEKVVLANVIKNFKVSSTQTYEDLSLLGELILRPETGVFINFEKRI